MKKALFLLIPFLLSTTGCVSLLNSGFKKNSSSSGSSVTSHQSMPNTNSNEPIGLPENVCLMGGFLPDGLGWMPSPDRYFHRSDLDKVHVLDSILYHDISIQPYQVAACYMIDYVSINGVSAGWTKDVYVNGNITTIDGCFSCKTTFVEENLEDGVINITQWNPDFPGISSVNLLTDNLVLGPDLGDNVYILSGSGIYSFVFLFYYSEDMQTVLPGYYGFAAVKTSEY